MFENLQHVPLWIIAFLISAGFHEFAHAFTAFRLGDSTAADQGRMTVNPIPHIDVTGLIFLVVSVTMMNVGIGWAKPVPVNPYNLRHPRRDMMLISFAGPLMNMILAAIIVGIFWLVQSFVSRESAIVVPLLQFLYIFGFLNVLLASFNLIPLGMLDGAKIVAGLLPEHLAERWERTYSYGTIILLILLFTGVLMYILMPIFLVISYATGFFTIMQ